MCVCSSETRAGSTPGPANGANASANRGVQPRSSRLSGPKPIADRNRLRELRELQPAAKHFGHAPRLGDAAAREERRFGVEYLADLSDARVVQVLVEIGQQLAEPVGIGVRKL